MLTARSPTQNVHKFSLSAVVTPKPNVPDHKSRTKRQALGCRLSPKFVLFKLHALHKRPLEISPNFVVFRHAKTAALMYASAHQFTFVVAKTVEIRGINGQKPRC